GSSLPRPRRDPAREMVSPSGQRLPLRAERVRRTLARESLVAPSHRAARPVGAAPLRWHSGGWKNDRAEFDRRRNSARAHRGEAGRADESRTLFEARAFAAEWHSATALRRTIGFAEKSSAPHRRGSIAQTKKPP